MKPEDQSSSTDQSTSDQSTDKIRGQRSYRRALRRAADYLKSPERLQNLRQQVRDQLAESNDRVKQLGQDMQLALRLIKAWADGSYRSIPWNSLLMLVAAFIYFIVPLDSLPDFVPIWGFVDDAAILGWTLRQLRKDLEAFRAWEAGGEKSSGSAAEPARDNIDDEPS